MKINKYSIKTGASGKDFPGLLFPIIGIYRKDGCLIPFLLMMHKKDKKKIRFK